MTSTAVSIAIGIVLGRFISIAIDVIQTRRLAKKILATRAKLQEKRNGNGKLTSEELVRRFQAGEIDSWEYLRLETEVRNNG